MSFSSRVMAPLLVSSCFAMAASAQDIQPANAGLIDSSIPQENIAPAEGSGDEGYDYRDYCNEPLELTTQTASEFFNLVGCDDHGVDNEFWINTPLVAEDFPIPTPEDFNKKDPLALCMFGSLPDGTRITDEVDDMVGTGDFVMGRDVLRDLERGILYECLSAPKLSV